MPDQWRRTRLVLGRGEGKVYTRRPFVLAWLFLVVFIHATAEPHNIQVVPASPEGFGNATHTGVWRLFATNQFLYAGTWNTAEGCGVFVTDDAKAWKPLAKGGFGDTRNFCAASLQTFGNFLYVGVWNPHTGGQLFRHALDGKSPWEPVTTDGFGDPDNECISQLWVFDGRLYAACTNYQSGLQLYRSATGSPTDWEQLDLSQWNAPSTSDISTVLVRDTLCLVGTETLLPPAKGAEIRRLHNKNGDDAWMPLNAAGFGKRANQHIGGLAIFKDNLYAATWNGAQGFEIWCAPILDTSPLPNWVCVGKEGLGNKHLSTATCLTVYKGMLIVGVRGRFLHEGDLYSSNVKVTQAIGGALFSSSDGTLWKPVSGETAWGPPFLGVQTMTEFQGKLYVGVFSLEAPARAWQVEILD